MNVQNEYDTHRSVEINEIYGSLEAEMLYSVAKAKDIHFSKNVPSTPQVSAGARLLSDQVSVSGNILFNDHFNSVWFAHLRRLILKVPEYTIKQVHIRMQASSD